MRLLFPEVEVTRSLSSRNLLKAGMMSAANAGSRIIDSNALIAERIGSLRQDLAQPENEGFTEGLLVEEVDVSALLADPDGGDSLFKAAEETVEDLPEEIDLEEIQEQARGILQDAKDAAAKILQDAIAEAEEQAQGIYAKAQEDGYQAGYQKAEGEFRMRQRELDEKEQQMAAQFDAMVAELEPQFVDTLSGIYEHLFHVELGSYRDILLQLLTDCIRGTEGCRNFQIHVSPEDYTYVSTRKAGLVDAAGGGDVEVDVVEDPSLHKNACVIRTENSIIDCGLGTQLEELTRRLKLMAYGMPDM